MVRAFNAANLTQELWNSQQNAAREANLKAVRDQQYKNEMQNYQNGYRSTLPNY